MSEVKWYSRGRTGEYVLDCVESVADGYMSATKFRSQMLRLGLSAEEVEEVCQEEGIE